MNTLNDRYNNPQAVKAISSGPEREPEIKTALSNLAYQLKLQEGIIQELTQKLSLVLRQDPEKDQSYPSGGLYSSQLACELGAMTGHVDMINNKIITLIGRVEL